MYVILSYYVTKCDMNENNSENLDLMNCMNEQLRDYRFV